jgi:hypothetical protein
MRIESLTVSVVCKSKRAFLKGAAIQPELRRAWDLVRRVSGLNEAVINRIRVAIALSMLAMLGKSM